MCFNNGKGGCCMVAAILLLWLDLYGIAMRAYEYASHVRVRIYGRERERGEYIICIYEEYIVRERPCTCVLRALPNYYCQNFAPRRPEGPPTRFGRPPPAPAMLLWSHHCMRLCVCLCDTNLCSFAITKAVPLIFIHQLSPGRWIIFALGIINCNITERCTPCVCMRACCMR